MIVWLLLAGTSWADDDEKTEDRKVVYKQRTEIDFESVDVEALLVKPQGTLVLERKQASFNPMINLRKDFNVEIEQSTNEIK